MLKCHSENKYIDWTSICKKNNLTLNWGVGEKLKFFFLSTNGNWILIHYLIIYCRNVIICMPRKYPVFLTVLNLLSNGTHRGWFMHASSDVSFQRKVKKYCRLYGPHRTSVGFQNSSHKGHKLYQAKDPGAVCGTGPKCRLNQACVDIEDFKSWGER